MPGIIGNTYLPAIPNLSNFPNRHVRNRGRPFKNVNTRRYKCIKGCSQTFITSHGRKAHYQTVHQGRPYECLWPRCRAVFSSFLERNSHITQTHILERMTDARKEKITLYDN